MQHQSDEKEKDQAKEKDEERGAESGLGLISNALFLRSLLSALLEAYKCIKRLPWVRNNDVLLVILLRVLALVLCGVELSLLWISSRKWCDRRKATRRSSSA